MEIQEYHIVSLLITCLHRDFVLSERAFVLPIALSTQIVRSLVDSIDSIYFN